jgi:hypothetical protein
MQLDTWSLEVDGQDYAVSVERAENGKDVVRINGRIATKPIGAEEKDRSVSVGGLPYILVRRSADQYDLQPVAATAAVKSPAAMAQQIRERDNALGALGVLAKSNAPVALPGDPFFKRLPIMGWIAIAGLIAVMLYVATGPGYTEIAVARVNRVLSEMHEMKGSQFAVTYWYKNKKILGNTEMSIASDTFDRWSRQKGFYRKVGEFQILDAEVVKGESTPTAIVHFKLEGNEYRVKVPKDLPITWVE